MSQSSADVAGTDARLRNLGILVELERRARRAEDEQGLGFLMVNETQALLGYRQAVLWQPGVLPQGAVRAVSGLAVADSSAPYIVWITRVCAHLAQGTGPRAITAADLPESLNAEWSEWLPAHALWLPLRGATPGVQAGGMLLAFEQAPSDAAVTIADYLADAYGHAWNALQGSRPGLLQRWSLHKKRLWAGAAGALVILALFPVHQSTVAPAEVVARDPTLVRAPIDGVIDQFEVEPNAAVTAGQVLLTLDSVRLQNQLDVARKALEIADAEYRQAAQQALSDVRANANVAILKSRRDQHIAEIHYIEGLLQRIVVRAPRAGVAIFDNANDWLGRPVAVGERILEIADPAFAEIEVLLPVGDLIDLPDGARVRLFLNVDPHRPREARLRYASYEAIHVGDRMLAYRLLAVPEEGELPLRVGLKGTAKVYGKRTMLILYLLRRPLTAARQALGL